MPSLRARTLLRLASRPQGLLVAEAADHLAVTRACAGAALRGLERDGLVEARLVDGGRLHYTLAEDGARLLERPRELALA